MTKTNELIAKLSNEITDSKPVLSPSVLVIKILLVSVVFGFIAQLCAGIREDISSQLSRPMYLTELAALLMVCFTSIFAAIYAMYPDVYQKKWLLDLPYFLFSLLIAIILFQFSIPADPMMSLPIGAVHNIECTISIAVMAILPAAFIFYLIRKGASVCPLRAGSYSVMAASTIGCFILRLAEANDSVLHLTLTHYIPTLLFAVIGAYIGKLLLKW